ncbi:protein MICRORCHIDIA 2-like [Carex rostrata]
MADSGNKTLACRNFWKAGSDEVPSVVPNQIIPDVLESYDFDRARVHPKFLHTNATSHKWAFGAIAELLDNAVDEICHGATFVRVDKTTNPKDGSPMLLFQDDGGGMDPEGIRRCMSLGFSSKRSKTTIGQYGNGFKTSTMRLGADAVVFTRAFCEGQATVSIGLLSYTFLRSTMKDDIIVPMLDFKMEGGRLVPLVYSCSEEWDSSLKLLIDWSPFSSKEELLQQFEDVGSHGTKVLIYNLWMNDDGLLELDFDDDEEDILLRDQANNTTGSSRHHKDIVQHHISHRLRFSLRAYTSILYMRKFTNFKILLRGKPVEQVFISEEMKFKKSVTYKPQVGVNSEVVAVRTTIGFAKEAPVLGIFGVNVYHKNRLIMPFWKVLQEASSRGRSVLGVLEANFIEPAHDKQDFERTPLFIRLESKLRQIIVDYWKDNCHLIGYQGSTGRSTKASPQKAQPQKAQRANMSSVHVGGDPSRNIPRRANLDDDKEDNVPPANSQGEDAEEGGSMASFDPNLIETLTEENSNLLSRRDKLQARDAQLRLTIAQLEKELEETRRKCAHAAAELQHRQIDP